MADSAQAWTWTEGSGGLNLVSTISQFVKNPVGRLVELKWLSVFVIDDEGLQCQQTISIYIGFVPGSCSPQPEVEAPTTLRWGDRAASSQWRFTSLRKHRIPRRSSWGSPTPAVSDAHPEFLGRCSNVRLWTSFKLEYVLDKIRGKFRFTDLGSRLKESSFILPIVFLFLIKHRSGSEHELQTRRHAVRNSCHLKLAFMWPLHWSRSNSPDALKTQRKVAKRRAATTSSIGSH